MFLKKLKIRPFISTLLLALPLSAFAGDLTVINNTKYDSTVIVNDGICSSALGDKGITKANSTNVIPQILLYIACGFDEGNCKADVYMTDNCSGPKVGLITLDIQKGISNIDETGAFTFTSADPFQVQIDEKGK